MSRSFWLRSVRKMLSRENFTIRRHRNVSSKLRLTLEALEDRSTPSVLSTFELDGNATTPPTGPPGSSNLSHDWSQVYSDYVGGSTTSGSNDIFYLDDKANSALDDTLSGGQTKDTYDMNKWGWSNAVASPSKADLTHAIATAYTDSSNGHKLLYVAADRWDNSGDSTIGVWFLQKQVTKGAGANAGKLVDSLSPNTVYTHQNGDLLLVANIGSGGGTSTVAAYKWQNGALVQLSAGLPTSAAFAVVNTASISAPWSYTSKSGSTQIPAGGFFEVGVDLNAPEVFGSAASKISTFLVETRNSGSTSAVLSDFIIGKVSSEPNADVKVTVDNAARQGGQGLGFNITIKNTGLGTLNGITVTDQLPKLPSGNTWSIVDDNLLDSYDPNTCFQITTSAGFQYLSTKSSVNLAESASLSVHITASSTNADVGIITNTAVVGASNEPANLVDSGNTSSASITIGAAPTGVTAPSNQSSDEGENHSFSIGSFSSTATGTFSVRVHWGDAAGTATDTTFTLGTLGSLGQKSHVYADNGVYTVTVTVTDPFAVSGSAQFSVTVANVAPTAILNAPSSVNEGSNIAISLTAPFDPSSVDTSAGFTYAFDTGSGYGAFGATSTASVTPNDDGSLTIKAKIKDKDGGVTEYTKLVIINNVNPTALASNSGPIDEGASATASLSSGDDVSSVDKASLRYFFSLSQSARNAATYATSSGSGTSTAFTFNDNGTFTIYSRVLDKDGGFNDYSTNVVVNNVAPTATPGNSGPIGEGGTATASLTAAYDPSSVDATSLHYFFTLSSSARNAAGYANGTTSNSAPFQFAQNGTYTVYSRVIDKDGGYTDYSTNVVVNNVNPTATVSNSGPIYEGNTATASLTGGFDPSGGVLHYFFSLSQAARNAATYATSGTGITSAPFPFDDNGVYTVYCRILDADGGYTDYSTDVVVNNVAPTATVSNTGPIDEGGSATVSLTAPSDPSVTDSGSLHYFFSLNQSARNAATYGTSGTSTTSSSFGFNDNGTYTVYCRILDKDGGYTDYSSQIVVNNVAPSFTLGNTVSIDLGDSWTRTRTFSDPGLDSDWTVHIVVTKDTTSAVISDTSFDTATKSFVMSPDFSEAGDYTITVTITDKDGGSTSHTLTVHVLA